MIEESGMRNEKFRCGRRPRIENLGWWRRFALALVTGRQNLSQGSRLSPARAGLRQAARSAPGGVPALPEGTKARPGPHPSARIAGTSPYRGGFWAAVVCKASPARGGGIALVMTEGCIAALPCQYPAGSCSVFAGADDFTGPGRSAADCAFRRRAAAPVLPSTLPPSPAGTPPSAGHSRRRGCRRSGPAPRRG